MLLSKCFALLAGDLQKSYFVFQVLLFLYGLTQLGPVLFLLYAAGVINLVDECGFCAYTLMPSGLSTRQPGSILRAIGTDGELHLPSRSLDGQQPTTP